MLVTTSHAVWRAEIPNNKAGSVTDSVMRKAVLIAAGLFVIGCGPDPNAQLPGVASPAKAGGTTGNGGAGGTTHGSGGIVGSGGKTTSQGGTGGINPFAGGTTGSTGGIVSSGGVVGAGGVLSSGGVASTGGVFGVGGVASTGGVASSGGVASTGGVVGAGGSSPPSSGAIATYTFGSGAEPCTPTKDVSGGQSGNLGTAAVCLRTADDFTGWNCNSMDDRTVKINTVAVKCGAAPPPKVGSFYYFDISAGATAWASFSWFCGVQGCSSHPVPSCGHYPSWVSGGSAAPCADATSTDDASVSTPGVDSGS
jgi:hypothetical protein